MLIYLLIYLKYCLQCLFAKHDLTCYLKQKDLEKQMKQWNNILLTAVYIFVKSCLLAHLDL